MVAKTYIFSIIGTFLDSLLGLIGVITLAFNQHKIKKFNLSFVAFAAGVLLTGAFMHLVPDSFEKGIKEHVSFQIISLTIFLGILFFYTLEKLIMWHHHHNLDCNKHHLGILVLTGDFFHNIVDGLLIGGSFLASTTLGFIVTLGVILHEIPHELSNFFLLVHSGFSVKKAIFFNFLTALASFIGLIISFFFYDYFSKYVFFITAFAAGNFIYLSLADILPEVNDVVKFKIDIIIYSFWFFSGIVIFYLLSSLF